MAGYKPNAYIQSELDRLYSPVPTTPVKAAQPALQGAKTKAQAATAYLPTLPTPKAQVIVPSQGTPKAAPISASQPIQSTVQTQPAQPVKAAQAQAPAPAQSTKTATLQSQMAKPYVPPGFSSPTQYGPPTLPTELANRPTVAAVPQPPKLVTSNDPQALAGQALMKWFVNTPGYLDAQIRSQARHQDDVSSQPYEPLPGYKNPFGAGFIGDTMNNLGAISRNAQRLPGIGGAFEAVGDYGGDAVDFWLNAPVNAVITEQLPGLNASAGEMLSAAFDTWLHPPMDDYSRTGLGAYLSPDPAMRAQQMKWAEEAYQQYRQQQMASQYPTVASGYHAPAQPTPAPQPAQVAMAPAPAPQPMPAPQSAQQWALQQAQAQAQAQPYYIGSERMPSADQVAQNFGWAAPASSTLPDWSMPNVQPYQRRQWQRPERRAFENPLDQAFVQGLLAALRNVA